MSDIAMSSNEKVGQSLGKSCGEATPPACRVLRLCDLEFGLAVSRRLRNHFIAYRVDMLGPL